MKFIEAKSVIDDVLVKRQSEIDQVAKIITQTMVARANKESNKNIVKKEIDNLLDGFSDAEKYEIMKSVFLMMA